LGKIFPVKIKNILYNKLIFIFISNLCQITISQVKIPKTVLPTLKSTFTAAQVTAYDNYIKQLKGQFDGYVRAYKGYSVYVL
jgi:hypothetical protein